MKRKLLYVLLCTTLAVFFMTGCGSTSSGNDAGKSADKSGSSDAGAKTDKASGDKKDKVIITFDEHLANVETNAPQVYNIVEAFNVSHPDIHVELTGEASDEHEMAMKLAAQNNDLPDIFYVFSGDAKDMAANGYLADISKDINKEVIDSFLPGVWKAMDIKGDGSVYGIASEMFVNGIWYNKKLFDECSLQVPVTFDDMLKDAKVFKDNGIVMMARGTKDAFSTWACWTMHCRYGFYDHIDGIIDGTDKWENDDFIKFYTSLQKMSEAGMFPDNMTTMGYDEAQQMFMDGKAAMFDSGAWDAAQFESCDFADDIGFWWGPEFSDGVGNQEIAMKAPSHPYCISAKTKEEEPEKYAACIEFLNYFYGKEGTQIIVDSNCVPVTNYTGTVDENKHPVFAKLLQSINDDWGSPSECPNVRIGTFESAYFDSIAGVFNGIYTPEQACQYLDEQSKVQGLVKAK